MELTLAMENSKHILEFSISNGSKDHLTAEYIDEDVDRCIVKTKTEKIVYKDFMDLGFQHFENFMKKKNLKIGNLELQVLTNVPNWNRNKFFKKLEGILKEIYVEVKSLSIHTYFDKMYELQILPYLPPGKLEEIHLTTDERELNSYEEDISRIPELVNLVQWRFAKVLEIENVLADLPMGNISHFDDFRNRKTRQRHPSLPRLTDRVYSPPLGQFVYIAKFFVTLKKISIVL